MEFWGAEVLPNKSATCELEENTYMHISNAALSDTKKCAENENVILRVKCGNTEVVAGTLVPGVCNQMVLDLIFSEPFTFSHNSKNCSVYVAGYKTELFSEDDEDEDEEETLRMLGNEPQSVRQNGKPALKDKKAQLGNAVVKSEDDDSSDDGSEDDFDDDSDDLDSDKDDGYLGLNVNGNEFSDDSDDDSDDDEDDDGDDDEDGESDDEDEESDEELTPQVNLSNKKKRFAESPLAKTPSDKKIKTPSGKPAKVEMDGKPSPQKTPKEGKKSDKKVKKETPKTSSTDSKPAKGTPGSEAKKLGQYNCDPCKRSFTNESALTQHNSAKHKK